MDGDDHPGISVFVRGPIFGRVDAVRRIRSHLGASITETGQIDGVVRWAEQQLLLGASHPLLLGVGPSLESTGGTDGRFHARRLNGALRCSAEREAVKENEKIDQIGK